MGHTPLRAHLTRRSVLLVCTLLLAIAPLRAQAPGQPASTPVVYLAEVDGIIHGVSAEYLVRAFDAADAARASLIVVTLRTPGGAVDSTREIIGRMIAKRTPVAVFVGPSGARAASAGFLLTMAADVAAMAPGTHIGAAHPVAGNGQPMDETMSRKSAEDVAAYVRTLASTRRRNVELAAEAVHKSRAFTEREALDASPPLIDLVTADVPSLLAALDGREVRRFDGSVVRLSTAGARTVRVEMTRRQRILSAVAHPTIAYLLLSLGMLGLTVEFWSPGAVFPGVAGGISLLLAFFALQVLPVNVTGALLMAFGILLFALEIKITSYGLLTIAGLTSLIFGSLMLLDGPTPELQLSLRVIIPVVLGFTAIGALLVRLAAAAQRQPARTGAQAMVGEAGTALSSLGPGEIGQVAVHGEIWRAVADTPIPRGTPVRVVAITGLTLTVRKD